MRLSALMILGLILSGCASAPSFECYRGGDRVDQPGVSFVLPKDHKWVAIMRSTYQSTFGVVDTPKNDTLIVASSVYNISSFASEEEFLESVRNARSGGPKTGRFEIIRNTEWLDEVRSETCVMYQSASRDFGVEAKRGGEFSILETTGMHCVHPVKPEVGVQVEFSRKAPPQTVYPDFEAEGKAILASVVFHEF